MFDEGWTSPKAVLEGFVLFSDPLNKEDWKPRLEVVEGGWSKERPNMLHMRLGVAVAGVVIEGEVSISEVCWSNLILFPRLC